MSIIDTLITNRESGDAYTFTDVNRVEDAMRYLQERLKLIAGTSIKINGKNDWVFGQKPRLSDMRKYLNDVTGVRSALSIKSNTPSVPISMRFLTAEKANDIEKILQDIDELIIKMQAAFIPCGTRQSGQTGGLIC